MHKIASYIAQQIHIPGLPQVNASTTTLRNVLTTAFAVAGAMAVLFILIGAGRYAAAAGDPGQLKRARDTILYALIGLVVAVSAIFIVQFALGALTQ